MNWSLFIFIVLLSSSCINKPVADEKSAQPDKRKDSTEVEFNNLPTSMYPQDDSGYSKGPSSLPLLQFEVFDSTVLEQTLSSMINQQTIVLLDSATLSHSMYADPQREIRYDTLQNNHSTLLSVYHFGKRENQKVTLNGKVLFETGVKPGHDAREVIFDFNETLFRHFSFYGKEYYYINAQEIYTYGGSARNVYYHFIFDNKGNQLATWSTCRFWKILIGDVNGDKQLDYIGYNNEDFCTTVPSSDEVTITYWSAGPAGIFIQQKDAKGKPWQIDARTGENYDSLLVLNKHWPGQ